MRLCRVLSLQVVFPYYMEKKMFFANLNTMTTLKIGFSCTHIVYISWINVRYIILDINLLNFFLLSLQYYSQQDVYISTRVTCILWVTCQRIYSVSFGLRGRIDRVIPALYITDRMFNRPGSYRLWVSVIRVVCPVNVGRLGTFEYEFMFRRRRG